MATHCGLGLGEPVAGDNAGVGRSGLVVGGDYWIGVRVEGISGGHGPHHFKQNSKIFKIWIQNIYIKKKNASQSHPKENIENAFKL